MVVSLERERPSPLETEPGKSYALLSVSDKRGLADFARVLTGLGYVVISTEGTGKALTETGISVVPIQKITGNPECLDGRMKTISFQVEAGILVDRKKDNHLVEAQQLELPLIDIVVCNLYPFEETIAQPGVRMDEAVEMIDVGGPTMVRAAAKNWKNVLVVVDPNDYPRVAEALLKSELTNKFRRELAAKAFTHLSSYDAQIARFLGKELFPDKITLPLHKERDLRYGDNPDQEAVLYVFSGTNSWLKNFRRFAGKELSATNITDLDAGIKAVRLFETPAAVVIKHNTPCGIALGKTEAESLARAIEADPESAFGGVVVLNTPMTPAAVEVIARFKKTGKGNLDIVASPSIEGEALGALQEIRKSTGIYSLGELPPFSTDHQQMRWIDGGFVIQTENNPESSFDNWTVVTEAQPTPMQLEQMRVAWKFLSRIRSNTVIVVDEKVPMTRGIGTGQTSRVLATEIALKRAGDHTHGGILASDSFFPFDDSVRLATEKGIVAIVQQGGSVNDQQSIDAANEAGMTMVFTHQRVFWH